MKYIACIGEGGAERAILDLLLDNHKLKFEHEDLIEEEVLRCRSAREFENKYLRKSYKEKITIYRVLDSRSEKFNLSKPYANKVDVKNVITAPEIEMLIIHSENKYKEYKNEERKNHNLKPSIYCKTKLKYKDVKSYEFVKKYFSDIQKLINVLTTYHSKSKSFKDEMSIWDLLK